MTEKNTSAENRYKNQSLVALLLNWLTIQTLILVSFFTIVYIKTTLRIDFINIY